MSDGKVVIDIELDASDAKAEADSAGKAVGREFTSAVESSLNKLVKVGAAAASAIVAGTAALTKQSLELYASYEQLVGGVDTLFKDSGEAVKRYANNAYRTAGMSANQYMETVTGFSAALINSLGGDTAAAAEFANMAITDMADNANKMGTSIDSIQQTYASLARGNYAMLDNLKLGYAGTKEGLEELMEAAEAYQAAQGNMVDYSVDSYADIVSAIHDVQTEMGITGATASEAATTIEGSVNAAKAAWENWLVSVADENASMEESTEQLMAAVVTAAENVIPRIAEIISTLLGPISGVVSALAGLLAGFAAFKAALAIQSAITAFRAAMAAVEGATGAAAAAQALFNTVLKANPIAVVASLIATLVAALVTLFVTNEDFRAAVTAAWENVKRVALDVWGAITTFFTETIPKAIQSLVLWFTTLDDRIREKFQSIVAGAASFVSSFAQKAVEAGQKFFTELLTKLAAIPGNVVSIGRNIVEGIWNGISAGWGWLVGKLSGFANNLISKVKEFFGIHSPSTVFRDEIGVNLSRGIVVGYEKDDPVRQIEASLSRSMSSLSISAAVQASGAGGVVNHFTIERIDAHDMQGIDNVNALIGLFQRNAYA